MQAKRGTGIVGGKGAEAGATEIAVVAGWLGPLAHLLACLGIGDRSDKAGYYEGDSLTQELSQMKTKDFPVVSILPKNLSF